MRPSLATICALLPSAHSACTGFWLDSRCWFLTEPGVACASACGDEWHVDQTEGGVRRIIRPDQRAPYSLSPDVWSAFNNRYGLFSARSEPLSCGGPHVLMLLTHGPNAP